MKCLTKFGLIKLLLLYRCHLLEICTDQYTHVIYWFLRLIHLVVFAKLYCIQSKLQPISYYSIISILKSAFPQFGILIEGSVPFLSGKLATAVKQKLGTVDIIDLINFTREGTLIPIIHILAAVLYEDNNKTKEYQPKIKHRIFLLAVPYPFRGRLIAT